MTLPDEKSPVWILLRQFVLGCVLLCFCSLAYHNKMSETDIMLWLTVGGSLLGVDITKRKCAPPAGDDK